MRRKESWQPINQAETSGKDRQEQEFSGGGQFSNDLSPALWSQNIYEDIGIFAAEQNGLIRPLTVRLCQLRKRYHSLEEPDIPWVENEIWNHRKFLKYHSTFEHLLQRYAYANLDFS